MVSCQPKKVSGVVDIMESATPLSFIPDNPCAACEIRELSICGTLQGDEFQALLDILRKQEARNRDPLISEGDPADYVFNVTSGAIKLYKLMADGRRQITGFLFEGDFLGIAMYDEYPYSAEAIGRVNLCRFDRRKLRNLLETFPKLEHRLLSIASNEIAQAQDQMLLLGRKTAREKLCSFLMALSKRMEDRGRDPSILFVPMSRADIGDYLGLTTETVSRTFTALKRSNVIRLLEGNRVMINEPDTLQDMADGID
ncbi:MAG: cyclic nucleotide-binding domain-containing protein [Pseudomonadota bacterium]